jgi:protein-tyrosine phosphatase
MIDIHSHLLPGVDDGSPSVEKSIPVLERFANDGVEVLVCTPHLNASEAHDAPVERYREVFEERVARAPAVPRLALGWEIMLDIPRADLRAPHLALGGSKAVLVEFARRAVPAQAADELKRLRDSGVVPVVAHPERYWECTTSEIRSWRQAGAVIQVDSAMLGHPSDMGVLARAMLEEGLVDIIASDNHGDKRSLASARDWLRELGADEQAQLLTHTNPGRLLADESMIPVSPLPRVQGVFGKLAGLFGRKKEKY